jgi:hypothetical protein
MNCSLVIFYISQNKLDLVSELTRGQCFQLLSESKVQFILIFFFFWPLLMLFTLGEWRLSRLMSRSYSFGKKHCVCSV